MTTFLEYVAKDIYTRFGEDLAHVVVVFPNKRAALFLNQALVQLSEKPVWSPSYITISDLFRYHSDLQVADPIKAIAELHKSFVKVTGKQETLDQFLDGDSCCWLTSTTSIRMKPIPRRCLPT